MRTYRTLLKTCLGTQPSLFPLVWQHLLTNHQSRVSSIMVGMTLSINSFSLPYPASALAYSILPAVRGGFTLCVQLGKQFPHSLTKRTRYGEVAASHGSILCCLLQHGIHPMIAAATACSPDVAAYLVSKGANVNAQSVSIVIATRNGCCVHDTESSRTEKLLFTLPANDNPQP